MIEVTKIVGDDDLKKAFRIREKVFVEEQKVDHRDEYDEYEETSTHFLASENGMPLGTARWRVKGDKIKLERFAVLKEARGKGVGAALVRAVVADVKAAGHHETMYMHAQVHAVPFYEKLGFQKQGDMFLECDIEHYVMVGAV